MTHLKWLKHSPLRLAIVLVAWLESKFIFKDIPIKKLYFYIAANIILIFLSVATIIGDYGLVGDFGTRFAALNHGVFGYVAYLYMPFLLYPLYRLYKSHAITFRRLELCVSFSLFFIALLVFQSLSLAQGSFGNAIVLFLKDYIGYFGVWVLDIFFFLFSWLISTERNIDLLLKKAQNKLLVAFDFLKMIALASFYTIKAFLSRLYQVLMPKLKALFSPKTQDVLDLENAKKERTLHAAYDFKDIVVDTPFDEFKQTQHTQNNAYKSLQEGDLQAPFTQTLEPNISESKQPNPTQISQTTPYTPSQMPPKTPLDTTHQPSATATTQNTPTPPVRNIELVQRSKDDIGLEEFLKIQAAKHRDMLNNLKQYTAISEPIFERQIQEINPTQSNQSQKSTQNLDMQNLNPQSTQSHLSHISSPAQSPSIDDAKTPAPSQKREIQTPPPRPLNPNVFLEPTRPKPSIDPQHSQVREQNLQAAKATAQMSEQTSKEAQNAIFEIITHNFQANFKPTECDDNLQTDIPEFQSIKPLSRLHQTPHISESSQEFQPLEPQALETRSLEPQISDGALEVDKIEKIQKTQSLDSEISESSPHTATSQEVNLAQEVNLVKEEPLSSMPSNTLDLAYATSSHSVVLDSAVSTSMPLDSVSSHSSASSSIPTSVPNVAFSESMTQSQAFEVQITEIPSEDTHNQNTQDNKTNWADSIIEELAEVPAKEPQTPSNQASSNQTFGQEFSAQAHTPYASHTTFSMRAAFDDEDDDDMPLHKVPRVTELEENRAFLDGLEYGKVAKPLNFKLPSTSLLNQYFDEKVEIDESEIDRKIEDLLAKLKMFRVDGDIARTYSGPIVTTFEFRPAPNVKVSKILTLEDDLAMALRARSIRIQAPIPGKDVVGIEIPNNTMQTIYLREVLESDLFKTSTSPLTLALGKDIVGSAFITDLKRLPHLLIAGTTGSGKSVGINAMILSLLFKNSPDQLKLLMIDPKKVEFSAYADIPHLITPIITQPKKAIVGLNSAMAEMDRRYDLMSEARAKDIDTYNRKVVAEGGEKFPYLVIVIDELADLMMTGGKEVEYALARIAQMGRASGIHIIVATQRPSVDVVTGLIKTNLPSRISYKVGSKIDSKVILDTFGAESLLGRGDMLFTPPGVGGVTRLHAPWNSEEEIERVVEFIKSQRAVEYDKGFMLDERDSLSGDDSSEGGSSEGGDLLEEAKKIILQDRKTSASYLQRRLGVGYNKAANIVEQLERKGFLSAPNAKGIREIL